MADPDTPLLDEGVLRDEGGRRQQYKKYKNRVLNLATNRKIIEYNFSIQSITISTTPNKAVHF